MERGCMLLLMMVLIMDIGRAEGQLVEDFSSLPRPNVEALVKKAVSTKFNQTFTTIPATLPLFFHDCFVTGCDASTMVSSPNGDAEKDAPDNLSLAGDGFDAVVKAKQEVEGETIYLISIPARDVVVLAEDPSFNVELGRRDGLNLVNGKGFFTSDEVLFTDPASQPTVNDFANSSSDFNGAFATAIRKHGRVRVKTGGQGSIGTDCTIIIHENSNNYCLRLQVTCFEALLSLKKHV
ncbi:hypothetical protein NC653_003445 [Populus alba x Populus x berolinensis]|uniref:peroxidase n=1 Tax=Populus alba x Populus x berolinensis TaxID=444605 RepID=A0AAD6RSC9_9ROSI|nr:hypothetical protein NC653_003445 [Populus alba x Populus x berolinensis]